MIYDSGIITLCTLRNHQADGGMPVEVLQPQKDQYFAELEIGINRAYLAKGADEQIDALIQIQDEGFRPRIGMYAILTHYAGQIDEANGDQYRIALIQPRKDENNLPVYALQLERLKKNYDCLKHI